MVGEPSGQADHGPGGGGKASPEDLKELLAPLTEQLKAL